jgi:hypothetical protein
MPLPWHPLSHSRICRIMREIRALEGALVGHLAGVNHDLDRRAKLRGMIPK